MQNLARRNDGTAFTAGLTLGKLSSYLFIYPL
jgi:hypothetical protein